MPQEVTEDEVVVDPAIAANAAAEEAEFESGFADTPTEKTPPAEDDTEEEPVATPAAPEPPKYRQVTEAEWQSVQEASTLIAQIKADNTAGLDKAFGKVGGLERALKELQSATPQGHTVEITDDIVAELQEEFPEIGGLVLKSFKALAAKLKGTAPAAAVDPQELEAKATTAAEARLRALQIEALEEDHPNWNVIVGAPTDTDNPYRKWLATQPAEYQARLNSTVSAVVIGRSITKFETAAKAAADAAALAAAEAAKKAKPSTRQQRLEEAAVVKGAGGNAPGPTDDDQFEAGFKSG